jgi:hypothetical protein
MKMNHLMPQFAAALLVLQAAASATTISFDTDPFAGSDALTTPGRQVVGNELFTDFSIASDVFSFNPAVFGVTSLNFANGEIGDVPSSGVNVVVLRTFDNDNDAGTPFGAGTAANLIAEQITSPGAGFFIYFNSGLDLPRLVYSTDLSENTADLKILARLTNLGGATGRDALAGVTAANFEIAKVSDSGNALVLALTSVGAFWAHRRFTGNRRGTA